MLSYIYGFKTVTVEADLSVYNSCTRTFSHALELPLFMCFISREQSCRIELSDSCSVETFNHLVKWDQQVIVIFC